MRKLCLSPRGLLKWVRGERVSGVCHLLAFPGACVIPSLSQLPRRVHRIWDAIPGMWPGQGCQLQGIPTRMPHEPGGGGRVLCLFIVAELAWRSGRAKNVLWILHRCTAPMVPLACCWERSQGRGRRVLTLAHQDRRQGGAPS